MVTPLLALYQFHNANQTPAKIAGYFAVSTAPDNVEDTEQPDPLQYAGLLDNISTNGKSPEEKIKAIAEDLVKRNQGEEAAELVISVHGYNMNLTDVKNRHLDSWHYINDEQNHVDAENSVFLGYRWPSEHVNVKGNALWRVITSLPVLLSWFLGLGVISLLVLIVQFTSWTALITSLFLFAANITIALMLLRISGYFRDIYRASHFGVPDLVELVRQLDKAIVELQMAKDGEAYKPQNYQRIKLNFIAHSMGAFVTTSVVRILSDVFDSRSIGSIDCADKAPPADIGNVFCLGRLVLIAPDIPFVSIILGRANFLKSSLRRFEEAYLFSSEGDLALRVASTAANYFSYPTSQREWGHRLGNVTVTPFKKSRDPIYGIVNCDELKENPLTVNLLKYLEINTLKEAVPLTRLQEQKDDNPDEESIANLFTYFDCTDYVDFKSGDSKQKSNILSYGFGRNPILTTLTYVKLVIDWFSGKIDVHGGYFSGKLSKDMIYKLAFSGLKSLLKAPSDAVLSTATFADSMPLAEDKQLENLKTELDRLKTQTEPNQTQLQTLQHAFTQRHQQNYLPFLEAFSDCCKERKIQVVLSPERFMVDILGDDRNEVRSRILAVGRLRKSC